MGLYTEDAVFMIPNNPSAVGKIAVRQAYDAVFKAITVKVKFTIAELVVIAPHWAFVRTNSAGTQKINATGTTTAEANQELFILKKDAGLSLALGSAQRSHHACPYRSRSSTPLTWNGETDWTRRSVIAIGENKALIAVIWGIPK